MYFIKKNIIISKKDLNFMQTPILQICVVQCLYFQPVKHLGLAFYFYCPKDVKNCKLISKRHLNKFYA